MKNYHYCKVKKKQPNNLNSNIPFDIKRWIKGKMLIRNSEVDAYIFIKEQLESLGWNIKNPSRTDDGQVYTQGECLTHPELKKGLGQTKPENIVKLSETKFWVIESKKEHKQLQQAINEARDYAEEINKKSQVNAIIISGIAGNRTDSYLIESEYFDGKKWETIKINDKKASGLFKPEEVEIILNNNSPDIRDVVIDEKLFLKKAEKINELLHLGAINKNERAKVMSAILLSLIDETPPNIDATPIGLMRDINSRVENVLEIEKKGDFKNQIKIVLPPSTDNHIKWKKAIVQTIQELNLLNIRSAMNSGTDVLGKFYEVFLKYGNGAKEIGIVLTPRHITHFATEVLNVNSNDYIFDPTCGTGGFLVSAFDHAKKNSNEKQINKFKEKNIYGIEQEPSVVALALVNMIFRGDGKNNIIEGNCFQKNINSKGDYGKYEPEYKEGEQIITKVLMNPPFALKSSDEKEYKFVDYALKQMQDSGLLFSVLPYSCMVKSGSYMQWRKNLLENNTLLSVVTFPDDLFYPVGVHSVGLFVKKGISHPKNQKVLWVRALNDGFLKKKGKRLENPRAKNDFPKIKDLLQSFIVNQNIKVENIPEFQKSSIVDYDDENLELIPENYLDEEEITTEQLENEIENLIRGNIAFDIKFENKLKDLK
ncbi:DNA methyltransferase [Candidatus Woesearchaeota archaeon CG10_big_fil_rev_8_21_14_0_10_34_12]|nr:MAG: DNA methyltransferase [Candidatus Woesearchaeota archaeon CG10_big_fil_rev_8_21_14_0_10_34_12]